MRILLSYMVNAGEAPAADFMRAMTIAQQLEQKTRMEGKLEVAQQLLANGMDRNTVMKMTGLTADDLAQIRH